MWRLTVSQILARRFRLALTVLAVVLGVTFVAGTLVLTDTSQRLFDDQFATASAGVDVTVRDATAFDSAMGVEVERDPLPAGLAERIREVPGVADVHPVARGQGLLIAGGKPIVPAGSSVLSSWSAPPFGAFELRAGRSPQAGDEVVIDAATAQEHGIAVGETVTVRAAETARMRVVGLAGFGDRAGLPDTTFALVELRAAKRLLDLGTDVSEVLVVGRDGIETRALRDRLDAELGSAVDIASSRDTAAASAAAAKNKLGYLQVMLLAMAGAALLVGAFLIANTFSIMITQRTRELAVLRAAGATGRQVVGSVLGEALVVGVIASLLGSALGIAAAFGLRELVATFGVALPEGGMVVTPRTVIVAFGIGVSVTVASALVPARRAARIAPVEAMRESSAASRSTGRRRVLAGVATSVLAATAVGVVLAGDGSILLLGAGAALAVIALTLVGPSLAPPAARLVGRPLDAAGVPGRLARDSAARAPRRTAATAMALALGLALVSFMAVVASSVKATMSDAYDEVITADYVVESARGEMLGGLSAHAHHHLSEIPEVEVASRLRYGHWKDGAATRALTAVDPATLPRVTSLDMVAGRLTALTRGGIVLAEHVARERGVEVGDVVPMTFSRTGTRRLPVVGVLADSDAQALSTDYIIGLRTFSRHFSENVDASVFVKAADGVEPRRARSAIEKALSDLPTAEVRDQAAAVAARSQGIDQILGLVTALLGLAVLIALLGITNTLALSIVERTREIGLLRAVGMTRAQLRWMVRGEALLVAALAVVLGVALGIGFGASTVTAMGSSAPIALVVPGGSLLAVVAVATVAGLVAGLLPARRASKLNVLAAIASE